MMRRLTFTQLAAAAALRAQKPRDAVLLVESRTGPYELHPEEVEQLQAAGYVVDVGAESVAHTGRRWCAVKKEATS